MHGRLTVLGRVDHSLAGRLGNVAAPFLLWKSIRLASADPFHSRGGSVLKAPGLRSSTCGMMRGSTVTVLLELEK